MSNSKNILFMISGSIAAFKSCELVSSLSKSGHTIKPVMTKSATKFIGTASLEGLTGEQVLVDEFEAGRSMDHINLMNWADLIIISPATANTINSMANGLSTNIISSLFLAFNFDKPLLLFPAMNSKMYNHPATKRSLGTLKDWGVSVCATNTGELACKENGEGRLLETNESLEVLKEYL